MDHKPVIPEETRQAILEAVWKLVIQEESLAITQTQMAAAAGVSRQTLYLAFGGRAQLLLAMLDYKDASSGAGMRLTSIREAATGSRQDVFAYVGAWLDYLPEIYPVAMLLFNSADADPVAAEAYQSRFHDRLLWGLEDLMSKARTADNLRPGLDPEQAARLIWSLLHPTQWRLLVVEGGWTEAGFRESRLELVGVAIFPGHA